MADLGKSGGRRESDNRDKSMHGLVVALAMAGAIAGSAILFAYASSDGSTPGAEAASQPLADPEPIIVEKVIEKPVYIEKIKYINRTVEVEKPVYINRTIEVEKPVYINRTVEVEKEVPVYIEKEVEKPVYIYVNQTGDDERATKQEEDEQKEKEREENDDSDRQTLKDLIQERALDLLDEIAHEDDGDDEGDGDDKKRKDHGDDRGDDD